MAAVPNKQEFPALLTRGFHFMALPDLRKLCVDGFPTSKRRPQIMKFLEEVIEELRPDIDRRERLDEAPQQLDLLSMIEQHEREKLEDHSHQLGLFSA